MTDKELWVETFRNNIYAPTVGGSRSIVEAAQVADEAVAEFEKRFPELVDKYQILSCPNCHTLIHYNPCSVEGDVEFLKTGSTGSKL